RSRPARVRSGDADSCSCSAVDISSGGERKAGLRHYLPSAGRRPEPGWPDQGVHSVRKKPCRAARDREQWAITRSRREGTPMVRQPLTSVLDQARLTASRTAPDAELLEQFLRTRDEATFAALVRRHRPTVLAACRQVLADDADVEDAAQQTFLALWRSVRSIRHRQSVGGWLYGVAHRLAVKGLARARRRRVVEGRASASRTEEAHAPDISWREACAILHEELDRLADKHRLPLLLCYLDGKSRDEAAKQLGWSISSLRGHLERGRTRLRARLARRGVTLSAGLLAAAT